MICGLDESDAGESLLAGPVQDTQHQGAAYVSVLELRVDGDGSHPCNRAVLPKEVASYPATVDFRHYRIDEGRGNEKGHEIYGRIGCREIGREIVLAGEALEPFVADFAEW